MITIVAVAILVFLNPIWVGFEQDRTGAEALTGFDSATVHTVTNSILHDIAFGPPAFAVTVGGRPEFHEMPHRERQIVLLPSKESRPAVSRCRAADRCGWPRFPASPHPPRLDTPRRAAFPARSPTLRRCRRPDSRRLSCPLGSPYRTRKPLRMPPEARPHSSDRQADRDGSDSRPDEARMTDCWRPGTPSRCATCRWQLLGLRVSSVPGRPSVARRAVHRSACARVVVAAGGSTLLSAVLRHRLQNPGVRIRRSSSASSCPYNP